jgi:pectate lyase
MRVTLTAVFLWALAAVCGSAQTLAFAGAEGFGAESKGGRGGDVYHVTNLNDSGPGSLRMGIQSAAGPRTIVFDVSGTILLNSNLRINKSFLTLAGQTAPGDGITVSGFTAVVSNVTDVIIRYMRFRAGDVKCPAMQGDSLWVDKSKNVIIDHVSATWSIDEALSVTESENVTVQWSIIGESLNQSCHEKGEHGYGSLIRYGSGGVTFHHNLYVHNHSRNPRVGDEIRLDFVNNILYNYGARGGDASYSGPASEGVTRINYVNNYAIAGPSTDASRRTRMFNGGSTNTQFYPSGNWIDGNVNGIRDGAEAAATAFINRFTRVSAPFERPQVATDTAVEAYRRVLASAGASLVRDPVDQRIVMDVEKETGKMINSQNDVGGFPVLASKATPKDTDQDGIPDAWELARGLDPNNKADGPANLEAYLESLLVAAPPGAEEPKGTVILDDRFADGDSQNQDLANNSVRLFNGRTNNLRADSAGSVTIDMRPAATSSEAVWAFFTNAGSPEKLALGHRLEVAVEFALQGFTANGQDIRFGVFDSLGTRNRTNLAGGHNDATFVNDTGYAVSFFASGSGSPFVIGRRTVLSSANVFNSFGDFATIGGTGAVARQTLRNDTPYTLRFVIERLTESTTRLDVEVTGDGLENLRYSALETNPEPYSSFDSFAFRVAGTNFATHLRFTRLFVQHSPPPPVITVQPQPLALTIQVGSPVNMAVAAAGSALRYAWQKDGNAIAGASTPVFAIERAALSDAGTYRAVVSNPRGSVTSDPVVLRVSTNPVPPMPTITQQPRDRTAVFGEAAGLSVEAAGTGLFYQWFKNRVPIPGATSPSLVFAQAHVTDSGEYYAVVSNSSGSVTSGTANLLVVSGMKALSVVPWPGRENLCADTTLSLDFEQKPAAGTRGRIRILDGSGAVVDTIDLAANRQAKTIGGIAFNYFPLRIEGNRVHIELHRQLPYNGKYSVLIETGAIVEASTGAPWTGFSDAAEWTFRTKMAGPAVDSTALTVSPDSFSDFCSVQGAIDFVPANNTRLVTIDVQPGVYNEIIYVASNKPLIRVRGADRAATILQYPNNANLNPGNSRALFGVDAAEFTLENITLWNTTPKGGSQAEAFRGNNQRILLDRVNLKSFQDTLLLQGRGMVKDSYIEGDIDFLWGGGTVFIQDCELRALSSGSIYLQIRNAQNQNGYVIVRSKLTAAEGVTGAYLARIDPNGFPYSQAVFIDCAMGPHILPAGWQLNNAVTAPNVQFWEFGSKDLSGAALNVSQRALFSRQLTAAEAAKWSDAAFVLDGWNPVP